MVKARTLHLSGLNRTASPASYPQHGFVVQSVRMPRFWGDTGSNPVEARWAPRGHMRNAGFPNGRSFAIGGMNRSQDKNSFARMAHPPFLMPERFRRRSSAGRAAPS